MQSMKILKRKLLIWGDSHFKLFRETRNLGNLSNFEIWSHEQPILSIRLLTREEKRKHRFTPRWGLMPSVSRTAIDPNGGLPVCNIPSLRHYIERRGRIKKFLAHFDFCIAICILKCHFVNVVTHSI